MHVLVTGGAGFVGSVLVPMLTARGDTVRVVDNGMFGLGHVPGNVELIEGDILEFKKDWLRDIDAVVHLAGLSNDPMAAFSPSLNYIINAAGSAIVAHTTKEAGVRRFVYASTCSVYGMSDLADVDEEFVPSPSFPYATSKLMAERALGCLADGQFRPIMLRKGTVVGWSPRMRFDLVTNAMIKSAVTQGEILVHNASLWRPLLDVEDAARAYLQALDAPPAVAGVFNIATRNYSIGELGAIVANTVREFGVEVRLNVQHKPDLRSYRVSTAKAAAVLGYKPAVSAEETVRRVMRHIRARDVVDFENPLYHNVEQMKRNLRNGKAHPSAVAAARA